MKTFNDPRFRRPAGSRLPLRALGVGLLLIIFFGAAFWWRGGFEDLSSRALAPVSSARGGFFSFLGGVGAFFSSKVALEAENQKLGAELAHAQALIADRDTLAEENLALKEAFGRADAARRVILAGVIARPPGMPYDTLLIDAGREQGIQGGAVVFAGGGAAIGTVANVYEKTARVALYSSPGATYDGLLTSGGRSPVALTIEGDGGGSFSGKIPAATPATVGDALVLPGIAGGFMGSVSGIDAPEGDSFKTLYFRLPVNIFQLQFVQVEK